MCRNIKQLHNFEPPATDDEVLAAALQYVRKIAGTTKPSKANERRAGGGGVRQDRPAWRQAGAYTSICARTPAARARDASQVTSGTSSSSARATYIAS